MKTSLPAVRTVSFMLLSLGLLMSICFPGIKLWGKVLLFLAGLYCVWAYLMAYMQWEKQRKGERGKE